MKASIYNASAGSGKTYRLAYQYVRDVVEEPSLYRHILAVTFTNKATEEMKRRILMQINLLASGRKSPYMSDLVRDLGLSQEKIRFNAALAQSNILHNYSRFTILTIDKFFQRLLRAFIQEIGIDIGYTLEIESSSIVDQGVDSLIEQVKEDENLHKWLIEFIKERIVDGKKWDVRDGIIALSGELFKEPAQRVLATNIDRKSLQKSIAQREQEAALKIAELKDIATKAMGLIEGAALSCESFKWGTTSGAQLFKRILKDKTPPDITARHIKCGDGESEWYSKTSAAAVKDITPQLLPLMAQIIEKIDETKRAVNTSKLMRENYRSFALLADLYKKTEEICKEQNTMLLNQTANIIEEFVRDNDAPFIYEKIGNRFSRFMIDEFQDTSRREWNNFLPLLSNALAESPQGKNPILIVGDIKQSIYRWRGGDWKILHSDIPKELGEEYTEVINMNDNYRSLPLVVKFNNEIIDRIVNIENQLIEEELKAAYENKSIKDECYTELHNIIKSAYEGQRQNPKRSGDQEGFVEVVTYESEPPIMQRIYEAIDRGFKPCEILILTRTNPQAAKVAEILLDSKRQNSDPRYRFDVMTQEALHVGFAPVSHFIMALFRLTLDPTDSLQLAIHNDFIKREVDTPLSQDELLFLRGLRMFSPIEAFEKITKHYELERERSNIAYIQAIHEQVIDFCNNKIGDTALFLKWWETSGEKKSLNVERSEQAIEIMTIHKAKGLEKRVVIIPYCNWKQEPQSSGTMRNYVWAESNDNTIPTFPVLYKKDMSNSEFAEEYHRERVYSHIDSVNMLYVALTRAAESLHIFVPVKVNKKGERKAANMGQVILDAIADFPLQLTKQERRYSTEEGEELEESYQLGIASAPLSGENEIPRRPYIMERYDSNPAELRLRMPMKRYCEGEEFAPREIGILMHKAFEQAKSQSEIFKYVDLMLTNSQINKGEHDTLYQAITESLKNPYAKEWFSDGWDRVRNESEIILPKGKESRRPDRVMIKGDRCVVVDYKFGALQPKRYECQMQQYMSLMRDMGYRHVEGYLWYIRHGEICVVEG